MNIKHLFVMAVQVSIISSSATLANDTMGACCFGNGFCTPQTQQACESVSGQVYLGDGVACVGDFTCPEVSWVCKCTDGVGGSENSAIGCVAEESACDSFCLTHGGTQSFQCNLGAQGTVPTTSAWGLLTMTLLVLISGTIILKPQR